MKKLSIFLMMLCFACFGVANAQQSLPYTYGFENNDLAAAGWTTQNPSGLDDSKFMISTSAKRTGTYGFQFSSYDDNGAHTQYLISPELDAANGVIAQFYYKGSSSYGTETFKVGYSTTNTDITSFTFGSEISTTNTSWTQSEEFNFPAGTKYVAIYYYSDWQYYLYVDDFSFEENLPCAKPENLSVTTDGQTATVTWDGTASNNFIVTVNGTPASGQTSPYTFNVALSTTYNISVTADCGGDGLSAPVSTSFTTPDCVGGLVIEYTLNDSYGDGWNGNAIQVIEGCGEIVATLTIDNGTSATGTLTLCGNYYEFVWVNGSYAYETSFTFTEGGTTLFTKPSSVSDGLVLYTIGTAPACAKPTGLAESNITINSADLSWTGSSSSYMVEYTPWNRADADVLPTGTMTTYTFPLNGTGTASVAIRHYEVTNKFRLIVDDIVVKDANGNTIYSQNFENCGGSMPAEFTTIDMDGDGNGWYIADNQYNSVNGSYGLVSASYASGALFPDNWIILSDIELGGSISFQARGQDVDFAAEKFCVFVCAEANAQQEPAASTSYTLGNVSPLTPNTPYSWNVKGICGSDESCPSSTNTFLTMDEVMVFTTQGNWNDASNWDLNRVPTANDRVRLDADATIPSGVVAYTEKIVFASTGTVTIKDGGQLKQGDNSEVTIEKEINAHGATTEDGGWYFIATPLTESLFTQQTDWAYVDITSSGTYDLYSFDPSHELEWVNFNNPANTGDDFDRLYNGQGYLYANSSKYTLHFIGSTAVASLNNTVTKDFEYDANSTDGFKGWRLVGNPFTCNAYLSYVDANNNVLTADFYTMNTIGNGYDLMSSTDALAPCTGAFINYSATGKIQYATEAPTPTYGKSGMINMTLSQGRANVDQARIRFGNGFNLAKVTFRKNSTKIYMPVENEDYAVVYTENNGEMPVNFRAEENGTYSLNFTTEEVSFNYLHLIDNMTGADIDLLTNPSYTFDAKTTDYESRFKLVFATGTADNSDNFAFYSNGNWIIGNEGEATLQVIDVTGRILSSQNINGSTSLNVNAAAGVYMLRLINGENVKVQKIVVR